MFANASAINKQSILLDTTFMVWTKQKYGNNTNNNNKL